MYKSNFNFKYICTYILNLRALCNGRPKASSDIVLSNFNFPRVQKKKSRPKASTCAVCTLIPALLSRIIAALAAYKSRGY